MLDRGQRCLKGHGLDCYCVVSILCFVYLVFQYDFPRGKFGSFSPRIKTAATDLAVLSSLNYLLIAVEFLHKLVCHVYNNKNYVYA